MLLRRDLLDPVTTGLTKRARGRRSAGLLHQIPKRRFITAIH
jgi:hypothetical protein